MTPANEIRITSDRRFFVDGTEIPFVTRVSIRIVPGKPVEVQLGTMVWNIVIDRVDGSVTQVYPGLSFPGAPENAFRVSADGRASLNEVEIPGLVRYRVDAALDGFADLTLSIQAQTLNVDGLRA